MAQTDSIFEKLKEEHYNPFQIRDETGYKTGIDSALNDLKIKKLGFNRYGNSGIYKTECIESFFKDSLKIDLKFVGCLVYPFDVGYNFVMKDSIAKRVNNIDLDDYLDLRNFFCRDSSFRPSEYIGHNYGLKQVIYRQTKNLKFKVAVDLSCEIDSLGNVDSIFFRKSRTNINRKMQERLSKSIKKLKFYPELYKKKRVKSIFDFFYFYMNVKPKDY